MTYYNYKDNRNRKANKELKKVKRIVCLFLVLLFLVTGTNKAGSLKAVWLVIDQLSLEELITVDTPNIDYLQQHGAFGLMNVRTAGHLQPESTYLSAGAGKRCQGSKISHIGKKHGKGAINNRILELQELNNRTEYQAEIGKLGEVCAEKGIKIAVLGNTDTLQGEKRTILSLVMDKTGFVPYAEIDKEILKRVDSSNAPWSYLTDWDKLKEEFLRFTGKAGMVFVETGDLTRIEEFRGIVGDERIRTEKKRALERIDSFLGFVLKEVELAEVQLGIIVPTPPSLSLEQGQRLSFLVTAGPGVKKGWLTSSSTRRKGIISITDLLTLFLQTDGIEDALLSPGGGRPSADYVGDIEDSVEWRDLKKLNEKITLISNNRPFFVKGFILVQLLLILLSIIKFLFKKLNEIRIFQRIYEYLLLALSLVPLNYIIISNTGANSFWYLLFSLAGLTLIEIYLLLRFIDTKIKRVLISTGLLVIIVAYDLLTGYRLMADSLLGYSSVIGARYYGLGNEYMGLFIGSVLISSAAFLELGSDRGKTNWLASKVLLVPIFVIMTYFIGAPDLGANFGGTVTALFSGGVTYFYLHRKHRILILVISIVFLTGLIYLNYCGLTGPSTHIGKAVELLINGDWPGIKGIIYRKLSMNLKLLRWTIWSRVLLAFIVLLIFLFKHPVPVLKRFLNARPFLAGAFYGTLTGSIVTMLVNDSGVVAAATLLFYPLLTLLYFLK